MKHLLFQFMRITGALSFAFTVATGGVALAFYLAGEDAGDLHLYAITSGVICFVTVVIGTYLLDEA